MIACSTSKSDDNNNKLSHDPNVDLSGSIRTGEQSDPRVLRRQESSNVLREIRRRHRDHDPGIRTGQGQQCHVQVNTRVILYKHPVIIDCQWVHPVHYRLEHDEGPISTIKLNPDESVLAIQRSNESNKVQFMEVIQGCQLGEKFTQTVKAKNCNYIIGFSWISNEDIALFTDVSIELYSVSLVTG